jgi:hypothetical protein
MPLLAPLPQARAASPLTLRFCGIGNPQQLQHEVLEKEAPIRRSLAGMGIAQAFDETQPQQRFGLRRSGCAADEGVIQKGAAAIQAAGPASGRPP